MSKNDKTVNVSRDDEGSDVMNTQRTRPRRRQKQITMGEMDL